MDDDQNNGPNESQDSSRVRTQSECSVTSDDGATTSFTGRRQRTTSQQFMVTSGLTSASPPKFVTLEEIMQAANGFRDMALVHQIVVDKDFKLEKVEPEPNSIQKAVKDTMRRAFWDVLREQISNDPPNYTQALLLLEEIKENLFSLLLPQHTRIRQNISEILDTDLIRQQAEKGVLDFKHYANYVISIMAKLCAPVRDETIQQLKDRTDVIETFQGILETLDLMKLDMANFTIQMARPGIVAYSVEWERKKFAEFLSVHTDGLEYTKKWLLKTVNVNEPVPQNVDYPKFIKGVLKTAFFNACIELIDWEKGAPYPETFVMDEDRLRDLDLRTNRLIWLATILLVALSNVGPDLQSITEFKTTLKEHILVLIQTTEPKTDVTEILPNIAEQVINDAKEAQTKYKLPILNQNQEALLKQQILDTNKSDHKVKSIVKQRVKDFFLDIIESSTANPQKVPSGLTALQKELTEIAGQFLRIVSYNNTVFGIYYYNIVAEALPQPQSM